MKSLSHDSEDWSGHGQPQQQSLLLYMCCACTYHIEGNLVGSKFDEMVQNVNFFDIGGVLT